MTRRFGSVVRSCKAKPFGLQHKTNFGSPSPASALRAKLKLARLPIALMDRVASPSPFEWPYLAAARWVAEFLNGCRRCLNSLRLRVWGLAPAYVREPQACRRR